MAARAVQNLPNYNVILKIGGAGVVGLEEIFVSHLKNLWFKSKIMIYIVILQYKYITMGATKIDHFTDRQNEISILAKALGHPARVAILDYLVKVNACICGDIVNELPLAQPTVSQHLKELKNAGLIKGSVEGNAICYCVDEKGLEKLQGYFGGLFAQIAEKKKECC